MSETLSGTGKLIIGETEHPCQYHLEIREDRRMRSGEGFVVSTPSVIGQAFDADKCKLRLIDGRSCSILITRYAPGNADAAFQMSGGFSDS
jgi:hypothetical protein